MWGVEHGGYDSNLDPFCFEGTIFRKINIRKCLTKTFGNFGKHTIFTKVTFFRENRIFGKSNIFGNQIKSLIKVIFSEKIQFLTKIIFLEKIQFLTKITFSGKKCNY